MKVKIVNFLIIFFYSNKKKSCTSYPAVFIPNVVDKKVLTKVLIFHLFSCFKFLKEEHSLFSISCSMKKSINHMTVICISWFLFSGGMVSREVAKLSEEFVMTVGIGDDLVMSIGIDSVEDLRSNMLYVLHACRLPKVSISNTHFELVNYKPRTEIESLENEYRISEGKWRLVTQLYKYCKVTLILFKLDAHFSFWIP